MHRLFSIRSLILALLSLVMISLPSCSGSHHRHNVILLVVDTLRADHLGCYGYPRNTSPHLDELADESFLFRDVTSQAPWTNPSVASLLTSLYPSSHHLLTLREKGKLRTLDPGITTLAEVMKKHGFATAAYTANPWLSPGTGFERGFDTYRIMPLNTGASRLNEMAIRWLKEREEDTPFFMYIHYMDVHGPYTPPAPYDTLFTPPDTLHRDLSPEDMKRMPPYLRIQGLSSLEEYTCRYDGGIRYWDDCLSRFLTGIRELGVLNNSILIVTADHGEEFLDHGNFNHGSTLYQEQIQVPLIWWSPSIGTESRSIRQQVELVDVMPTLLSILGIDIPEILQGDDLSPLFHGEELSMGPVFSEATVGFGGVPLPRGTKKSVKSGELKVIVNLDTGKISLFDLARDPKEITESSIDRERERKTLLTELRKWMEQNALVGAGFEGGEESVSSEVENRLRALGYLDQ